MKIKFLDGTEKDFRSLIGADLRGANLSSANLSNANLRGANLSSADLSGANLRSANLSSANLRGANLSSANLRGANLRGANLSNANLSSANLSNANLSNADLRGANLRSADLRGADLRGANLRSANLRGANLSSADLKFLVSRRTIVGTGTLRGFKKLANGIICELEIPEDAQRVGGVIGRKCRAEFARVLVGKGTSEYDPDFFYRVGEIVRPDRFDPNPLVECSSGIHFFITREEAEAY